MTWPVIAHTVIPAFKLAFSYVNVVLKITFPR